MCIRINIFSFKEKAKTRTQKTKETKEEKRIPVENLTRYNDIICKFDMCTFNLLDRSREFYLVVHMNIS